MLLYYIIDYLSTFNPKTYIFFIVNIVVDSVIPVLLKNDFQNSHHFYDTFTYQNKLLFVYDGEICICNQINHRPSFFYYPTPYDYYRITHNYIKMPYFDNSNFFHEKNLNLNFNEVFFNKTVQKYQKQFFESKPVTVPIMIFDARYENPFFAIAKKGFINFFFTMGNEPTI